MAERGGPREVVYCHSCENEWYRDEHGLECPECTSEIVEIIERGNDPRYRHEEQSSNPASHPQHPLQNHNPWDDTQVEDPGDPEEGNIQNVEYDVNGVHFRQTTYTSPTITIGGVGAGSPGNVLSLFSQILGQPATGLPNHNAGGGFRFGLTSPLQEGPPRQGHTRTFTATMGVHPNARDPQNMPQNMPFPFDDLHSLLSSILGPNTPTGPGGFPAIFARMFDLNAQHGDAVYSQEALDRVITELMEQHRGSTAPGPASAAAIAALPKVPVNKSMLDDEGKAECSVCMDRVEVGDEVTMLPCKHWFHAECAGAWLNEHDTCPHCRQSITPKEGNREEPRSSNQAPLHSPSWPNASNAREAGPNRRQSRYASMSSEFISDVERPEQDRPRTSGSQGRRGSREDGARGSGGGLTGWFSRRMGHGGNGN